MGTDSTEAAGRGGSRRARDPRQLQYVTDRAGARMRGSLSGALAQLRQDVSDQALRSAVYAGARVLYEELLRQAPVGPTGNLKAAVYHWHDDKQSVNGRHVYAIGVNQSKAPHWHLVEYGHWRVNVVVRGPGGQIIATKDRLPAPVWTPAHPFLRPTADRMQDALRAAQRRLAERLREIRAGTAEGATAGGPS